MLHLHPATRYYWFMGKTDFRKSFDGLCGLVQAYMHHPVTDAGAVFIFVNQRRTQIKLLHWEGDGLSIYHKRLERGVFESPKPDSLHHSVLISAEKLQLILQGIALSSVVKRKRYVHGMGLSTGEPTASMEYFTYPLLQSKSE
jgi:transposase